MKKLLTLFLSLIILMTVCATPAYAAPDWPANTMIEAEAGIVIDANSGAVIYGKNIHGEFHPASITKILTALVVIDQCQMDEIVTFSRNAVYNVESGSSNANLEAGEELTVKEALYAMMLKSANEAANALAEHVAGSNEEFAELMNAKASELGCRNSSFRNPSGLNDDKHYTSAYDMALIAQAAFNNETFLEIGSALYYEMPGTIRQPEGFTIYPGHKMIKKNMPEYYQGAIGGKTGYTTIAGHTLVTCAERDGMKLITVILKATRTHYTDTKTLLDFGFKNFTSLRISDYETSYSRIENDLTIGGLPAANLSVLTFSKDSTITLPGGAVFTDADSSITYELTPADPANAVAKIQYQYNDRNIGCAYLIRPEPITADNQSEVTIPQASEEASADAGSLAAVGRNLTDNESANETNEGAAEANHTTADETTAAPAPIDTTPFEVPPIVFAVIGGIIVIIILIVLFIMWLKRSRLKEEEDRRLRSERRQQRLREMGVSDSEFEQMVQKRRNNEE